MIVNSKRLDNFSYDLTVGLLLTFHLRLACPSSLVGRVCRSGHTGKGISCAALWGHLHSWGPGPHKFAHPREHPPFVDLVDHHSLLPMTSEGLHTLVHWLSRKRTMRLRWRPCIMQHVKSILNQRSEQLTTQLAISGLQIVLVVLRARLRRCWRSVCLWLYRSEGISAKKVQQG